VSFSKELQESSQVLDSMETKAEEWQEFAVIAKKDAEERQVDMKRRFKSL